MNKYVTWIKKVEKVREAVAITTFRVSWYSFKNNYTWSSDAIPSQEYKTFLDRKDAEEFCEALKEAHNHLRNKSRLNINIDKMRED